MKNLGRNIGAVLAGLMFITLLAYAYVTGGMLTDGGHIFWTTTDSTVSAEVDTLGIKNDWHYFWDSLRVNQRDIEFLFYGAKPFTPNTYDTLWIQSENNTAMYARPQTLNSTLDRFQLMTRWDSSGVARASEYGPSTFTSGGGYMPPISTDSALVFAIARLNTTIRGEYRFIVFKRPVNTGFTYSEVTTGGNTFVTSEDIFNAAFPDSGTTVFVRGVIRTKYP